MSSSRPPEVVLSPAIASPAPLRLAGREGAIDGVRGPATMIMIVVHCFAFFAAYDTQEHSAGFVILDVAKLTAVFILCMGVSSAFSRRTGPRDLARRGVELLLYGYGLNVLKFLVPILVFDTPPDGLTIDLGWEVGTSGTLLKYLFLGDILHMTGLSLLVIAGLRALGARPWHLFALAVPVAVLGPLTWGIRGGGPILTYLCDLLFSEKFTVFFPLFPWMSYVLVGFALGDILRNAERPPGAVFRRWAVVGALLIAAGIAVGAAFPVTWKGWDFYRTGPAGVTAVIGFSLCALLFSHVVWPHAPGWLTATLGYFSRRVTSLYVISWVVICWMLGPVGFMQVDSGLVLLGLTALVFAISVALDTAIQRLTTRPSAVGTPAA
jgi:uncharacterized membrane protein